jgi:hypothetical protein
MQSRATLTKIRIPPKILESGFFNLKRSSVLDLVIDRISGFTGFLYFFIANRGTVGI